MSVALCFYVTTWSTFDGLLTSCLAAQRAGNGLRNVDKENVCQKTLVENLRSRMPPGHTRLPSCWERSSPRFAAADQTSFHQPGVCLALFKAPPTGVLVVYCER